MTNERTDKGDIIEPVASLVQKVVYPSFSMGLNQITSIYRDLRSKTYVKERVGTFDERATTFIEKLQLYAGGKSTFGLIYLHILQQHISPFMLLWGGDYGTRLRVLLHHCRGTSQQKDQVWRAKPQQPWLWQICADLHKVPYKATPLSWLYYNKKVNTNLFSMPWGRTYQEK